MSGTGEISDRQPGTGAVVHGSGSTSRACFDPRATWLRSAWPWHPKVLAPIARRRECRAAFQGSSLVCVSIGIVFAAIATPTARGDDADDERARATTALHATYPNVKIERNDRGAAVAIYGSGMAVAAMPDVAAGRWLAGHAAVLGVDAADLKPINRADVGTSRLSAYSYRQYMDGVPVERSVVRTVVRSGVTSEVVFVSARLAQMPPDGFPPVALAKSDASAIARSLPQAGRLDDWTAPELVVIHTTSSGESITPVRVWKLSGVHSNAHDYEARTFYVHASTGALVDVVDQQCRATVPGQVTGFATPGTRPDTLSNRAVSVPVVGALVRSNTGDFAFADDDGRFVLSLGSAVEADFSAALVGEWVTVRNGAGDDLSVTRHVVRSLSGVELPLGADNELDTAQINAFQHITQAHDFFKSRQGDFTAIDAPISCGVNIGTGADCGGFFRPLDSAIVLARGNVACVNAAYSTIITHEYGHYILYRLGFDVPQFSLGEGFADTFAILVHDDPVIARDFAGEGVPIRDIVAADRQYPCEGGAHACGQALASVWWDIKLALQESLGDEAGRSITRQLFTDWSRITVGAGEVNAVDPMTAVEVLVVDDDDGDLDTLTPHVHEICSAFEAHNIRCPITDCNGNELADALDISSGTSEDCTDNGIPDVCESDCDGNGVADTCDIAEGRLFDTDGNGVADSCQATLAVPSASSSTIQSAIDAATDGDTVLVSAGIYSGVGNKNLDFDGKVIELRCVTPGACTIDCGGDGRGFIFRRGEKRTTIVDGFTITGGNPTGEIHRGGAMLFLASSPTIRNCRIVDNGASLGAGVSCLNSDPWIYNCVIAGNFGRQNGGAILLSQSSPLIEHCTIVSNRARSRAAGVLGVNESNPVIRNCVFWDNSRLPGGDIVVSDGVPIVSYSVVPGGWPGLGNMAGDPQFRNLSGEDYSLSSSSPVINRGDPAESTMSTSDALGNLRPQGCRVDPGAFESEVGQVLGDFDSNLRWDLRDLAAIQACLRPAIGNPVWRTACECVFDFDNSGDVDEADWLDLVEQTTGP